MAAIFLELLNRSIAAGWLILAVILLRVLMKKAPKWTRCMLWGLVGIRFICPFSFESVFSLVPSAQPLPDNLLNGPSFLVDTGMGLVDRPINEYLGSRYFEGVSVAANNGSRWMTIFGIVWLTGAIVMLLYAVISYCRLRCRVRTSMTLCDRVRICDEVSSPFVSGIVRPRIYLPSSLNKDAMEYVIAHETAHIQRRDHWWKPLGFLLLSVYWFHPLAWLAYALFCRDIELACDERVIKKMKLTQKKAYSEALLSCAVRGPVIAACPLAFGEVSVKERVQSVLNYKKPALWLVIAAAVGCAAVALCFLTNPTGVKITQIDDGIRQHELDDVVSMEVVSENRVYTITSPAVIQNTVERLKEIRLERAALSASRSDERGKNNILTLYDSHGSSAALCLNRECTELWWDDGVKPGLSHRVRNPELVRQFFESMPVEGAEEATKYAYLDSPDPLPPSLELSSENTFRFTPSALSSTIYQGRYKSDGGILTLNSDDGKAAFVFYETSGGLIFDAARSDPIPMFRYQQDAEPQSPVPDQAFFGLIS